MSTMTVSVKIDKDNVAQMLSSACEAGTYGSGAWLLEARPFKKKTRDVYKDMLSGFKVEYVNPDHVEGRKYVKLVTKKMIAAALKKMPSEEPGRFGMLVMENVDGDVGDAFMQLCVFGEVRYS